MKQHWKTILIVLVILFVPCGAVAGLYFLRKKKADSATTDSTTTKTGTSDTPKYTNSNSDFPLSYNPTVKSEKVKQLQAKMNDHISGLVAPVVPYDENGEQITSLKEDGYFGKNTQAVAKFLFNGETTVTEALYNSL